MGKPRFIPSLGMKVATYPSVHASDLKNGDVLDYHVPQHMRGPYIPAALANYEEEGGAEGFEVDHQGYTLCDSLTSQAELCNGRALNRSPYCLVHGGRIHPNDKIIDPAKVAQPQPGTALDKKPQMTRWQQLLAGEITVQELDDEELARGQCKNHEGRFVGRTPRMIPNALRQEMTRRLFERVDETFRNDLIGAAQAVMKIAIGDAYEPADRLQAAKWAIERVMGKNPDVNVHVHKTTENTQPWEQIFTDIQGGSRAESRERRGYEPPVMEAEVVEPDRFEERLEVFTRTPEQWAEIDKATSAEMDDVRLARMQRLDIEDGIRTGHPVNSWTADQVKEEIQKARAQRYAARAQGRDTVAHLPIGLTFHPIGDTGLSRIKFQMPEKKVPQSVLRKEDSARARQRRANNRASR